MSEDKDTYKLRNWKTYNESLCKRGSLILWLDESLYRHWREISTSKKVVGEKLYPDVIIEMCLTIKQVYGLKLRQSTGFIGSIFALMGLPSLAVPNYSTLSRRASGLNVQVSHRSSNQTLHIAVDSTGLKVFGEEDRADFLWKVRKHGVGKRRTWRKLHLAIDVKTQEIICAKLTDNSVDDAAMTEELLEGTDGKLGDFYGDGAYDKKKARKAIVKAGGKPVIPPPKNAVKSKRDSPELEERNKAIERIGEIGRKYWKVEAGYHKRSLSEVAMYRYKGIIGNTLTARKFENQATEIKIGSHILVFFISS